MPIFTQLFQKSTCDASNKKRKKKVALLPFNYTQQKVVKVSTKATTALFIRLYQPKSV